MAGAHAGVVRSEVWAAPERSISRLIPSKLGRDAELARGGRLESGRRSGVSSHVRLYSGGDSVDAEMPRCVV